MTDRALARVPLDWQVQATTGRRCRQLLRAVRAFPGVRSAEPVLLRPRRPAITRPRAARRSTAGAGSCSACRTATGRVPGRAAAVRRRPLGRPDRPADGREPRRRRRRPRRRSDAPACPTRACASTASSTSPRPSSCCCRPRPDGSTSQAPVPDNVLIVPGGALAGALRRARAHAARRSCAARCTRTSTRGALPRDPSAAYARALGLAKNLETRTAGTAIVGNNLATALDAARGDSLYARVAFLFLGLPGRAARGAPDRRDRRRRAPIGAAATRRSCARAARRGRPRRASRSPSRCSSASAGGARRPRRRAPSIGASAFGSARFGATARRERRLGRDLAAGRHRGRAARDRPARVARRAPPHRRARARRRAPQRRALVGRLRARPARDRRRDRSSTAPPAAAAPQLVLVTEGSTQASVNYWSFLAPLLAWIGVALLSLPARRARPAARPPARSRGLPRSSRASSAAPSRRACPSSARRSRARSR